MRLHAHKGDTISILIPPQWHQLDQGLVSFPLAQCQGSDLAVGAPARGGIPLLLPRQSLSHLVDHQFHDELLVFILVITNEWHGRAHHLWEEKGSNIGGGRKCTVPTHFHLAKNMVTAKKRALSGF